MFLTVRQILRVPLKGFTRFGRKDDTLELSLSPKVVTNPRFGTTLVSVQGQEFYKLWPHPGFIYFGATSDLHQMDVKSN